MKNCMVTAIVLWLLLTGANAQSIKKVIVNEQDSISGYYLAVEPLGQRVSSVLMLLPGYAERAEAIFPETRLHNVAYINNILVVGVAEGPKVYADSAVVARLNLICRDVITRYGVRPDQFVIGGFSAGGTIALRYAELCQEAPDVYPIQPKGVFAVDSPVDLFEIWDYFDREIARNFSAVGM